MLFWLFIILFVVGIILHKVFDEFETIDYESFEKK